MDGRQLQRVLQIEDAAGRDAQLICERDVAVKGHAVLRRAAGCGNCEGGQKEEKHLP